VSYVLTLYVLRFGAGLEIGGCNADLLEESRLRTRWEMWVLGAAPSRGGSQLASLGGSLGQRDGQRQGSGRGSCVVRLWGLRGA